MIILYRTGIVDWRNQVELIFTIYFQIFIETIKITKFRIPLCKLRLSSHRLEIEVGRCVKPNRTQFEQGRVVFSLIVNCIVKF